MLKEKLRALREQTLRDFQQRFRGRPHPDPAGGNGAGGPEWEAALAELIRAGMVRDAHEALLLVDRAPQI